jgi:hypothetical protein
MESRIFSESLRSPSTLITIEIVVIDPNLLNDTLPLLSCLLVGNTIWGPMGKALEVANQYYDLLNNKDFSGLRGLISENILFIGPVVQRSGAIEYIDALKRLFKFHKKSQMLKQFENGNDVCSIYDLIMDKPPL